MTVCRYPSSSLETRTLQAVVREAGASRTSVSDLQNGDEQRVNGSARMPGRTTSGRRFESGPRYSLLSLRGDRIEGGEAAGGHRRGSSVGRADVLPPPCRAAFLTIFGECRWNYMLTMPVVAGATPAGLTRGRSSADRAPNVFHRSLSPILYFSRFPRAPWESSQPPPRGRDRR
jgi:hypothetical protein